MIATVAVDRCATRVAPPRVLRVIRWTDAEVAPSVAATWSVAAAIPAAADDGVVGASRGAIHRAIDPVPRHDTGPAGPEGEQAP